MNVRMTEYKPSAMLMHYVEMFWEATFNMEAMPQLSQTVVPNGYVELSTLRNCTAIFRKEACGPHRLITRLLGCLPNLMRSVSGKSLMFSGSALSRRGFITCSGYRPLNSMQPMKTWSWCWAIGSGISARNCGRRARYRTESGKPKHT